MSTHSRSSTGRTPSSPKRPVDVVTGPTPTVEQLIEQQTELLPSRWSKQVAEDPEPQTNPDLVAAFAAQKYYAEKYRRATLRWQLFTIGAILYGGIMTYLAFLLS